LTVADVVFGLLLPLVVTACIASLPARKAAERSTKLRSGLGCIAGAVAGYFALSLGPWRPESHREWLIWLFALAVVPTIVCQQARWRQVLSVGSGTILLGCCSWLLIPDWAELDASRDGLRVGLLLGIAVNASCFTFTAKEESTGWLLSTMVASCFMLSVVLFISGSALFMQIGLCVTAAIAGLLVAVLFRRPVAPVALAFPLAVFYSGAMLVGKLNSFSSVPNAAYIMLALIPAAVGICSALRNKIRSPKAKIAAGLTPTMLSLAAVGIAAYAEFGSA
jgi:hypothetical protein